MCLSSTCSFVLLMALMLKDTCPELEFWDRFCLICIVALVETVLYILYLHWHCWTPGAARKCCQSASRIYFSVHHGSCCMQSQGKAGFPGFRSLRIFLHHMYHNRLLAVPAGLYSVNNYLKFAMQLYFKPTTAKMLSNLKVSQRQNNLKNSKQGRFLLENKRSWDCWEVPCPVTAPTCLE